MADDSAKKPHDDQAPSSTERAQALTWALLDDVITEEEMAALDGLLKSDETARNDYLRCIQLHTDLQSQLAVNSSPTVEPSSATMPILGLFPSETLPFGLPIPPAEDVKS
jgi:hypothetical protein